MDLFANKIKIFFISASVHQSCTFNLNGFLKYIWTVWDNHSKSKLKFVCSKCVVLVVNKSELSYMSYFVLVVVVACLCVRVRTHFELFLSQNSEFKSFRVGDHGTIYVWQYSTSKRERAREGI